MKYAQAAAVWAAFLLAVAIGREIAAQECMTFADVQVLANEDGAVVVHDLRDGAARAFIRGLENHNRAVAVNVDEVAAFWVPDLPAYFVVVFHDDCVIAAETMPAGLVDSIIQRVAPGA